MPRQPGQITFSRPVLAGLGLFALLTLGLLGTQIVLLTDQLSTVRTQRAIAQQQASRTFPLLDAVRRLVGDTRSSIPGLRTTCGRARAPDAARATIALASALLGARVGATTDAVRTMATQLTKADVGPAVAGIAAEFDHDDRLRRLLASSVTTLEAADRRRLVAHLDVAAQSAPRLEGMTRRLLTAQLDALAILKQSLSIQRAMTGVSLAPRPCSPSSRRRT